MPRPLRSLLALLALSLMTACAGHPPLGNPEAPYPPQREPQVSDILHLPTGVYVDRQTLYDHAERAQLVYVGETHDNPASHRLQLDLLQHLAASNPGRVTLAMEMFTPQQQPVLDRWVAGELSEKQFLKQVGWFDNWRMNFALYRDLLNYCQEQRLPVLALNANKELQRKVGRTPFDQLPPEEQAQLPELDEQDPYQRAMVETVYSGHVKSTNMLEGFQRVQTLWDETMAQNIADYMKDADPKQQLLVVAGGNHIRYGYGIPRRVFRRLPLSYLLVGSREIVISEAKQHKLMDIPKPDYPMPPYQFVQMTEYEDLANPGVKLGVMLDEAEGGLLIKAVIPGSVAEKSGIQKDDVLTRMDDIELQEAFDLIYELNQKQLGDQIQLTLQRGEETLTLPVEFTETEPKHSGMGKQHGKQ